jgi:hypothetical protein
MLGRLLVGILKGLVVGGLLGFGLAKLGFVAPGAVIAYLGAALSGVLIGLVAGKPIWAKDARIEAGMKAFVGALLACGLMYAARRWLTVPLPMSIGELGRTATGEPGTLGSLAVTSLALVTAVLGGFYEADNTPETEQAKAEREAREREASANKRIAAAPADALEDELEEGDAQADKKQSKK